MPAGAPASNYTNRPEDELLVCCARTNATPRIVEHLRALFRSKIDWDYFFKLARRHALVPLAYLQLDRHASDLLPAEVLQLLKRHYQENAARNLLLTAELCHLIKLLAASGIEAIPYKGPLLALFAYGDLSLRRFIDLDIMVRKSDVLRARELLLAEGYDVAKSLTLDQQQLLLRTQHNLQFTRHHRQLIVELHWEVASHLFASSVKADELWRDLTTVELNDIVVKTLSADDLLFSLCVHGSRHLWERLSWICDVAELIERQKLNWPALVERAAKTDSERMFFLGLYLAENLLGATLPPGVKQRFESDERLESLARNIAKHLFNGPEHVPASSSEIFKYNFGVRNTWRSRARYFFFMLRPTDEDLSAHKFPPGFAFAYYLMRPFRLMFKNG
jgi:Uncharacterised nucleotidyltransferase